MYGGAMRLAWCLLLGSLSALAETPHLTVEGGLPAGTASSLSPLAFSPALDVVLVERNDKRPGGSERSLNFYSRTLDLLGYAVLTTDGAVSSENVQWMGAGSAAQKGALAELATKARETLPKPIDKLWADWQKLRPAACPLKTAKREGAYELLAKDLPVAVLETPLAPADARRGCTAPVAGAPRCFSASGGDLVVVVPFKQECGVSQQLLVLYNAKNVEYLREAELGAAALAKGDLGGARKHLDASLALEPKHAPAHFSKACLLARSGVAFKDGRGELEQILGGEEERQAWLPKIKRDPALANWRLDADFARWWAQFPTRVPVK
jgi:hypothetical protein